MSNKTIIIADDHPVTGRGIESVLKNMGFNVIGNHQNGLQALNQIILNRPKYALLDAHMPGLCGIDIVEELQKKSPKVKTIIYTMYTDISLFHRAKELGVNGYLLKEFALEDLKTCMEALEKNMNWYHPSLEDKLQSSSEIGFNPDLYCSLSTKERAVLTSIAENKSTKEIAEVLFLSEKTIESHRRNIKKKLNLSDNRNALLVWAVKNKGFFSLME